MATTNIQITILMFLLTLKIPNKQMKKHLILLQIFICIASCNDSVKDPVYLQSLHSKRYLCLNNYSKNLELISDPKNTAFQCMLLFNKLEDVYTMKIEKNYIETDPEQKKIKVSSNISENSKWHVLFGTSQLKYMVLKGNIGNKYDYCLVDDDKNGLVMRACNKTQGKMWRSVEINHKDIAYSTHKTKNHFKKSHSHKSLKRKTKKTKKTKNHKKIAKMTNEGKDSDNDSPFKMISKMKLEDLSESDFDHLDKNDLLNVTNNNKIYTAIEQKLSESMSPEDLKDPEKLEIMDTFTKKLQDLDLFKCIDLNQLEMNSTMLKNKSSLGGGSFRVEEHPISYTQDTLGSILNPFDKKYDPLKATAVNLLANLRGYLSNDTESVIDACKDQKKEIYNELKQISKNVDSEDAKKEVYKLMKTVRKSNGPNDFHFFDEPSENESQNFENSTASEHLEHSSANVESDIDASGHKTEEELELSEDKSNNHDATSTEKSDDAIGGDDINNDDISSHGNEGHHKNGSTNQESEIKEEPSKSKDESVSTEKEKEDEQKDEDSDSKSKEKHKDDDSSSDDNPFSKFFNPKKAKKKLKKLLKKPAKKLKKALFG